MAKRLTRSGNSLALVIDRPLLEALEIDPDFLVARMNLARLALVAQRPDQAEQAYRAVLEADPRHLGAMLGLAELARARGDAAGTEEWLVEANRANPAEPEPKRKNKY